MGWDRIDRPLPGSVGQPKFNQLDGDGCYLYLQTQFGEDRCTQFRVIVVIDPQTHPQTDRTDYSTLRRSLTRSVINCQWKQTINTNMPGTDLVSLQSAKHAMSSSLSINAFCLETDLTPCQFKNAKFVNNNLLPQQTNQLLCCTWHSNC